MMLRARFEDWIEDEIGSRAPVALRQHLADRGYRLFSSIEHGDRCLHEAYHARRGFFRAHGRTERDALLGLLRQIWLTESLDGIPAPGAGSA